LRERERPTDESCLILDRKTIDAHNRHAIVRVVVTTARSKRLKSGLAPLPALGTSAVV
jgi:hypothetical protein